MGLIVAKPFSKILDTSLGLQDRLTFGKFCGLRVRDIISDEYQYIFWLSKQTFCKLKPEVLVEARFNQIEADLKRHQLEEEAPFLEDNPWFSGTRPDWDQDIPF